mgnify:CR=1 FL=1
MALTNGIVYSYKEGGKMVTGPILLVIFAVSIIFIILMTAKVKLNAFMVLILAAFGVGLAAGLPVDKVLKAIKNGFGSTLGSIGIVIICGTIIGTILEKTGAALSMANFVIRRVGARNSPLAMAITGFIVGIPIFCDSGFVILSALNKAIAERSKTSMAIMAVALSGGLYSIHCLIPPHPGATAAAGIIGVDLGRVIILGLPLAIPAAVVAYFWATKFARRYEVPAKPEITYDELLKKYGKLPNPVVSFIPIIFPIILIALKSIALLPTRPFGVSAFFSTVSLIGDPVSALVLGVFLSLILVRNWKEDILGGWMANGIKNAGIILAITGAGGAFGNILRITPIGSYLGEILSPLGLGIFLPFIIALALKTAQGSSTVAIITSASLVAPLMGTMGLTGVWAPALVVVSMGAGSMIASHANDSYFWVVSQFSDLDAPTAYKAYTTATILEGTATMFCVWILSLFLI